MSSVSAYLSNSFDRFNNGQSVSKSAIGGDLPTFSGRYARFMTMERGPQTDRIFKIAAVAIPIIAGVALIVSATGLGAVVITKAALLSAPWGYLLAIITLAAVFSSAWKTVQFVKKTFVDSVEVEKDNKTLQSWLSTNLNTRFEDLPKMPSEAVNIFANKIEDGFVDDANDMGRNDLHNKCRGEIWRYQKEFGELPLGISVGFDKFNQPVISLVKQEGSTRTVKFYVRANDRYRRTCWAGAYMEFEVIRANSSFTMNAFGKRSFEGGARLFGQAEFKLFITDELSKYYE